jgi:UDP-3-O-[3-hydroxymyristoyl] glucosamine N-acyltransferase
VSQLFHPSTVCESSEIGPATQVGALEFIAKTVKLGNNCVIGPHACIERDAVIGDRFVIQTAAQLSVGTLMEERVSIEALATIRSRRLFGGNNGDNNPMTPPCDMLA